MFPSLKLNVLDSSGWCRNGCKQTPNPLQNLQQPFLKYQPTTKAEGIKIPEQVAIVGFNDWKMAAFIDPPLTAVYQPGAAMGRLAAEIIRRNKSSTKRKNHYTPYRGVAY